MAGPPSETTPGLGAPDPAVPPDPEAGRAFENDPGFFVFPDTIPVAPGTAAADWSMRGARGQSPHRFKLLAGSIVVTLALLVLARPERPVDNPTGPAAAGQVVVRSPAPEGDRFRSHVRKVQAIQAYRTLAGVCVGAIRQQFPEITARGKPTLIHIEAAACDARCVAEQRRTEQMHAHWTELHLNGIWVSTKTAREPAPSSLRRLDVPACLQLVSAEQPSTRLVLDRDGQLFFAGEQENQLKTGLWVPDPSFQPSPGAMERPGISILLESGTTLGAAEAVQMVMWARVCKWHLGECVSVAKEQRAMRRLDETTAERLVEAGEAEARRLNYYRAR